MKKEKIIKPSSHVKSNSTSRNFFILAISLVGVYFAQKSAIASPDLREKISDITGVDFKSDSIFQTLSDVFPSSSNIPKLFENVETPSQKLIKEGLKPKHPVVMIPGFITSGLDVWKSTPECFQNNIRDRIWGSLNMVQAIVMKTECWLNHLALHPETGMDTDEYKLRAAQGFEAGDFVVPGYWVWDKLFDNLANLGYDPSNMHFAAYDWRLSPSLNEKRDKYFTHLLRQIESMVEHNNEKVVVVAHSMGTIFAKYFLSWVESSIGGGRRQGWVDQHIKDIVMIASPFMGVPKVVPALLSGEMRDTAQLGRLETVFLDRIGSSLSGLRRRDLFRTWTSLGSMLPIGGHRIWGNSEISPEQKVNAADKKHFVSGTFKSWGEIISFAQSDKNSNNITIDAAGALLLSQMNDNTRKLWDSQFQWSSEHFYSADDAPDKAFGNVLCTPLPIAPQMTLYSFYGTGLPTERAYLYKKSPSIENPSHTRLVINKDIIDKGSVIGGVNYGVALSDGDGTVPLLSLGLAGRGLWKGKTKWNPSGLKSVVREYPLDVNTPVYEIRGGINAADHVDIMGNYNMMESILRIAGGQAIEENIESQVDDIVEEIMIQLNSSDKKDVRH